MSRTPMRAVKTPSISGPVSHETDRKNTRK